MVAALESSQNPSKAMFIYSFIYLFIYLFVKLQGFFTSLIINVNYDFF